MKRKHEQIGLLSRIIIIIILYCDAMALKEEVDGNTCITLHLAYVKGLHQYINSVVSFIFSIAAHFFSQNIQLILVLHN